MPRHIERIASHKVLDLLRKVYEDMPADTELYVRSPSGEKILVRELNASWKVEKEEESS